MFDLPLHPVAVHFPIAIGLLMPFLILVVFIGMKRWNWPHQTWLMIVLLQLICFVSSLVAVNLGERDEEKPGPPLNVELLEQHEEIGEKVPWTSGALLLITLVPVFIQRKQKIGMTLALICSFGLAAHLIVAGHSGGKLVYSGFSISESSIDSEAR